MGIPDRFVAHAEQVEQYEDAGLMAENIMATALSTLGMKDVGKRPNIGKG